MTKPSMTIETYSKITDKVQEQNMVIFKIFK